MQVGRRRRAVAFAVAGCTVGALVGVGTVGSGSAAEASTTVPGSAAPVARADARVGAVPATQRLTVAVWLAPDLAGAERVADAVATPGNPAFHHYLRPDDYTARFGPSRARAGAVAAWLTARGLTHVQVSSGRDYVSASGPAATVQSAFDVRLNRYRSTGTTGAPTVVRANDRAVSLPRSLAPDVLGVTGLTSGPAATAPTGRPAAAPATCSHYWAQHTQHLTPAYRGMTTASLPICGYPASQLRAAYGATWRNTGRGQTVALTESEAPDAMLETLRDYARTNHLPAPKPGQFRQIQAGSCPTTARQRQQSMYNDEAEMDSEAVYAMAPGAQQLMVVGGGCDEDQALLNADLAVLTGSGNRPSASIVSNSWQLPVGSVPAATIHAIDVRAAAEGVGMYFSSGDTPGLTATASDPYAVAVGGTTLGVGARNNRVFETGWSDDEAVAENGGWSDVGISGAGGGTSTVYPQPAYQRGVVPASMAHGRAVPDIAADADLNSGMLTGYITGTPAHYYAQVNAGTSLACPLVAGLVADAQQGQRHPFGFVDPLVYRLAGTRALHDVRPVTRSTPQRNRIAYSPPTGTDSASVDLFDAQDAAHTHQVTAPGYDTMTGVGTPNGTAFLTGLRRLAATP